MGSFMAHKVMNVCEIKECEVPESKIMVVGMELTLNVPSITSGTSCAISADT
jgi:hypothetical protein